MATQVEPLTSRRVEMFRALAHPNYRLFWTGAFLSNIGTWMQTVAQGWLVLQLTNSAFWLGLDTFMATVPALLLTLIGGVFADLISKRRLLIWTQAGAGAAALALALLVTTGWVQVWMILALSFINGSCMAMAWPAYQAIIIDLVQPKDLTNAVALYSTQKQLSRVIGPMLAGLTIKAFGVIGCFLANGLSYVAVLAALAAVKFEVTETGGKSLGSAEDCRAFWVHLIQGFRYVQRRPRVRTLLLISTFGSMFGAPYLSMMPLFARDVHGTGETGLALMTGAVGTGALSSALLLIFLGECRRKGPLVLGNVFTFSVCLVGFALSTQLEISVAFLFGIGFSMVNFAAVINVLLQQLVPDRMRGRVMSMLVLSFLGPMPFASFIAGLIAQSYGAPRTLGVSGLILALFTTVTALRSKFLRGLS